MNWLEKLYRTYENCNGSIGDKNDKAPLLPICHIVQQTQIEVSIDADGNFRNAWVVPKEEANTIIPCTEDSAGRTSGICSHPLCDRIKYLAADYFTRTGEAAPEGRKGKDAKLPHVEYLDLLGKWSTSQHSHPRVQAIHKYIQRGTLIHDLCTVGVLPTTEDGSILEKWEGDKKNTPAIFASMKAGGVPTDAFVRWSVSLEGDLATQCCWDRNLWQSWADYYLSTQTTKGICHILGTEELLATQHPKKIRNAADGAKLISANDSSGFTYRGKFTDSGGTQACGISFDVSQKAHNTLRWLLERQGRQDGDQAVVAWATSGKPIPKFDSDSFSLLDEEEEAIQPKAAIESPPSQTSAHVAQAFALRLKQKISGYHAELGNTEDIVVLALDSATPGRIAVTYYRELKASEFLARIEAWHSKCSWFQNFGKARRFVGAPSPRDIATTAFGRRLDDKLLAATYRRLLPCIIDAQPIPIDIVNNCVRRASSRSGIDHWEWEKALGIACALYRKQTINQHTYQMALERENTSCDYLYGRLLAVADHLEASALNLADENRDTNAGRLMQRFADHPFSTWRTIELSLDPYKKRLRSRRPGWLMDYEKEQQEIMGMFKSEEFKTDRKLSGEFLLAYHCQRSALWEKRGKKSNPSEETLSTEEADD